LSNSWAGSFGFSYDNLSRRTQLTRPNGITTTYNYDNLSRLLSVLHQSGSTTLDGASYTYDPAGNRTSKTDMQANVTSNYTYDAIYQLLQVTQGTSTTESYSYDLVGNRLSSLGVSPYQYNTSNELTSTPLATYTYDANGNTKTKTDATGATSYTWDPNNRLTQVTLPGTGGTVTFKYDPFGRRVQKSGPNGTTNYLYDGSNSIEELDNGGNVLGRYARTKNLDEPLSELRSGIANYYQQDALGSVTSLSNSTGTLAGTYTYDSYGRLTSSTGTVVNPFQYTGREFDSETGIYYYRARYFDPSAGRFLSEDRLRFGQGPNFYRYVQNNPLSWIDPSGNGTTCVVVTANGMTQVPCSPPPCGDGGDWSCTIHMPPGPPPLPPGDPYTYQETRILNGIDKCLSEEIEEINQIETEASNSSFMDLPWLPGKSLTAQAAEAAADSLRAEWLAHLILRLDYLVLGYDMGKEWYEYNKFKRKLNGAKQRRCKCIRDAAN
jgi:RHS repeat-associated protein